MTIGILKTLVTACKILRGIFCATIMDTSVNIMLPRKQTRITKLFMYNALLNNPRIYYSISFSSKMTIFTIKTEK